MASRNGHDVPTPQISTGEAILVRAEQAAAMFVAHGPMPSRMGVSGYVEGNGSLAWEAI